MSFDVNWDIDKYREDHESDEHWQLRRNFMELWQPSYPEERLVCLSRVFANMEFMGCRYPQKVMQEVARMSKEVNREITCNNNLANISSFDGQNVTQATESVTTNTIKSAKTNTDYNSIQIGDNSTEQRLHSNNSDNNQDLSNQYVWSSYTSEVMQGPVSIAKVLRTEHLKSFIRENSPNFRTFNKFPRMDISPQSNLSEFLDPRNATMYQKASDSVPWTCRQPNSTKHHNVQDGPMIPQKGGIDTSGWLYQNAAQACNNHMLNCTNTSSVQSIHEEEQNRASQESTHFGGNCHQQDKTGSYIDYSTLENQRQNYWSQAVNSFTGVTNPQYPTIHPRNIDASACNIGTSVSNIGVSTNNIGVSTNNTGVSNSNIVTSINANYAPACNIDEYANNVSAAISNTNSTSNVTTVSNTVPTQQIVGSINAGVGEIGDKKTPYKKRRGAAVRRYKYWLHAGKSEKEAAHLSSIRLSRVPEYKVLKKTLGSVKHHHKLTKRKIIARKTSKSGPPSANTRQAHQRNKTENVCVGNKYKFVKSSDQMNSGGSGMNEIGRDSTNKADNVICNKGTVSNTNAENSVSTNTQISEHLCRPVSDITSLTNEAKSITRQSRKDIWIQTKQNSANSEHIEHTENLANTENPSYMNLTQNVNHVYNSNVANTVNFAKSYTKAIAPDINTLCTVTVNTPNITKNIKEYKICVKDAKKEIHGEELVQLQNALTQCISDNNKVKLLRAYRLRTCALVICGDEYSRDWLDKQIPTLMPWEGAELMIINESDMPVFFYAWIFVPDVPEISSVNTENFLKELHEQNNQIGCDNWKVLNTQIQKEGQLFLVRLENHSEKLLQKRGYKLNWFSTRPLRLHVKRKGKDLNTKNAIQLGTNKKAKKSLSTKAVIEPLNQNRSTYPPKNEKNAKNPIRNTANIVSNKIVKDFAPVIIVSDEDDFSGNLHKDNNSGNKIDTNTPVVFGSVVGNKGNLNPFGMSTCSDSYYYQSHGDHTQPSSSHVSGTHRNDLQSSISNEYTNTTAFDHQAKLVPVDNALSAEKRIVYENLTVEVPNDIRKDNINLHTQTGEHRSSTVDNSVQATKAWGIDTPRMLPGHRSALKLSTDLWDYDDPREETKKISSFDRQKYRDEERDYNFLDVFTERDEEFSLEERVFAARKTLLRDDREIPREDRILERDKEYSVNRNYAGRDISRDEDFYERSTVYSSRSITKESRLRYSQEDLSGQVQEYSFDEITNSDNKNSRRSQYSREDNTYGRRENSQEYYVNDERERYNSWEDTDMYKEYQHSQQECQERDWDERRQGYSCKDRDLEEWNPDYSQKYIKGQENHDNMYVSEERYRENRSVERGDRVHPKGIFDRTDEYFRNRDYQNYSSRTAHSREILVDEDEAGSKRDRVSKRNMEPDRSRPYQDSRSDCSDALNIKTKNRRRRALKRARRKEFKLIK